MGRESSYLRGRIIRGVILVIGRAKGTFIDVMAN